MEDIIYFDIYMGAGNVLKKISDPRFAECKCIYHLEQRDGQEVFVQKVCALPACIVDVLPN